MLPPKIDSRTAQDLMRKMDEMVPYYTPEWRFSIHEPDPGSALFMIFSEMFQENVKRFNRVPYKQFIAFLNILDISLLSPQSAYAYLTFKLTNGANEPVFIPSGTQVSANVVKADEVEEVFFETDQNMLITPANLQKAYMTNGKLDHVVMIDDHSLSDSADKPSMSFPLFHTVESANLQKHAFYLSHPYLFNLRSGAQLEMKVLNSRMKYLESEILASLANPHLVEWLYWHHDKWVPFDEIFVQHKRLVIRKLRFGELTKQSIHHAEDFWIKCVVKQGSIHQLLEKVEEFSIDEIKCKVDYFDFNHAGGIIPDQLFLDDVEVSKEGFYPFGEYFSPYATFYIASEEVLSKRNGKIKLQFDLKVKKNLMKTMEDPDINWKWIMKEKDLKKKKEPHISISQVVWEYWNGYAWVLLPINRTYEGLFYKPEEGKRIIEFECPEDLEETFVNGQLNYWIRVRVLQMDQIMTANSIYLSPWLEDFKLSYTYENKFFYPERCITQNNLELIDHTEDTRGQTKPFPPFIPLDHRESAFYLAFDKAPTKGPISIFVALESPYHLEKLSPNIEWEYLGARGTQIEWAPLKVFDQTNQMTRSGMLQFIGPDDFVRMSIFNENQYWIRAVNRNDAAVQGPIIKGIYLNTVRSVQQETIYNEFPDPMYSDLQWEYVLAHSPVLSADVWIDETGHLTEDELKELERTHELKVMRDSEGNLQRCWVKWTEVMHFLSSTMDDRHYVLNAAAGRIRFGDGKKGKIPPKQGSEYVSVKYTVGGGVIGNVERKGITNLQNALAFVQSVSNPEPAVGGADMETMEEAMIRGPQLFKHKNRAVTAEDFEWLIRQKFQQISKVKCLPNTNVYLEKELGTVTIVVLPKDNQQNGDLFIQLKPEIEQYLLEHTAGSIAFPESIQVIEPVYLEISVHVTVVVKEINAVHDTEQLAKRKIEQFLNPYYGHYDGKGWEIGEDIHPTLFYSLLKSIDAVNHVDKLFLHVVKIEKGRREEIAANELAMLKHGMIQNGKHHVVVNVL